MLTIRSWTDRQPSVRSLARRIRQAGRRIRPPGESIKRVQVVVFPSSPSTASLELSGATIAAIERARSLPVEVTIHRPRIDSLAVDPSVLWLFVLDGAELEPHALGRFVELFDADPDLDMVYGDAAAHLDSDVDPGIDGPWLLPGFSPDRLVDQFYLGHVVALRAYRLVPVLGGQEPDSVEHPDCRPSTSPGDASARQNGAGAIEGPWRLAAVARTVAHVPEPLYRPAPGIGLWETDPNEQAEQQSHSNTDSADLPPVSVIIPTNGSVRDLDRGPIRLVDQAVRSVVTSRYPRIEIVVVLTPGSPDDLAPQLEAIFERHGMDGRTLTVATDRRPFNFSNACNRGAIGSTGDVLVFLNDDTEVIARDWLEHLVHHARKPAVGAVGARLLYEDGRVQHSGIWSRGGHPTHRYEGRPGDADGYLGALRVTQNCLAVTGACLAVERSKFDLVGGFSPVFPNSYNDVDLCLKLWDRGYRTVVEPRAELYHFEASTRDPSITDDDLAALHDRWRWRLNDDPFDNPNHTAERSEEWPLPAVTVGPSGGDGPRPRRWPLDPIGRLSSA